MTRPAPERVERVVASVPRGKREVTTVSIVATGETWSVDLKAWTTFPDGKTALKRPGLRLAHDQLRDVAAALIAVADFQGAQARETATPEQLAALVDQAAINTKTIVAAVATGNAVFLKALPDRQPFRVYVGMPSIMAVLDHGGAGPGAFDYVCLRAAFKMAHLVVLTVDDRIEAHYHAAGSEALQHRSSVIIETTADQTGMWLAMLAVETPDVMVLAPETGAKVETSGSLH